jgi:hypothetical protein
MNDTEQNGQYGEEMKAYHIELLLGVLQQVNALQVILGLRQLEFGRSFLINKHEQVDIHWPIMKKLREKTRQTSSSSECVRARSRSNEATRLRNRRISSL